MLCLSSLHPQAINRFNDATVGEFLSINHLLRLVALIHLVLINAHACNLERT